jgi:hypothetical protein
VIGEWSEAFARYAFKGDTANRHALQTRERGGLRRVDGGRSGIACRQRRDREGARCRGNKGDWLLGPGRRSQLERGSDEGSAS